jgi:hypothetical protein
VIRASRASRASAAAAAALALLAPPAAAEGPAKAEGAVRVAVFNTALSRGGAGLAWKAIAEAQAQPRAVVEVVQTVRPDVLLVLELDRDPEGLALAAFAELLEAVCQA